MSNATASENLRIAARLREAGEQVQRQGANAFAAAAYHRAAETVERWPCALREVYERRGEPGLRQLPGIGRGIARAILERMRPERSFFYTGDDGIEHECVVVDPRPGGPRPGREAIAELLRRDRHNGRA